MAKVKNPLLSLAAIGSFGKSLSIRGRKKDHIIESRPHPHDPHTVLQLGQRAMWQMVTVIWHGLGPAEKDEWERGGTARHMTGYSWFMSQALKPNPGIYLPLAGGTMTGDIDIASHKILQLPAPIANEEPSRKAELDAHTALDAAIHGLKGFVGFSAYQTSPQSIPTATTTLLQWHATDLNTDAYFDLANDRFLPLVEGWYSVNYGCQMTTLNDGTAVIGQILKNGALHKVVSRTCVGALSTINAGGSCLAYLNGSTDYLQCTIKHTHGANRNTGGASFRTFFQGFLIPQS